MKAARIHRFGPPDVIEVEDVPRPNPAPGEVLVRIAAVVNAAWSAECRVALAKSWRECDHGLIKALAKGPVSD